MNHYSVLMKNKLKSIIKEMASAPWLFAKNPEKDFTRKRKLDFESLINLILSMGTQNLNHELMEFHGYHVSTASPSALIQQRDKILPTAFEFLLSEFTSSFQDLKDFAGYRLLAIDGTDLSITHNPDDPETYLHPHSEKGFNLLHLNALYDLCNKLYVDAIIQPGKKRNEYRALNDMVDRSSIQEKVIVIANRGYESYNVFAHIEQKGWNYAIRVKDINSSGILSKRKLTEKDEFDETLSFTLTRKQTNEIKANPERYQFIPSGSTFDFLDLHTKKFYPITLRAVRFKLSEDTYETIITNLDVNEFPAEKIKYLYQQRWGIETSFRELKYAIGLTFFHSKKVEYIYQEVLAGLIMYNFCEKITLHVIIEQKDTKHKYQANFTAAIRICRHFYKCKDNIHPPDVEALIRRNILPVRNGRNDPRKVKTKSAVSFNYRVA
jgi:hypothetical protein